MTKSRLEAFSDGVFAIAATILVLNIKFPESAGSSNRDLNLILLKVVPDVLTFIFTFLVVGIFWTAHHRFFSMVKKVNHYILWSNNFYLMSIALLPFPAALLAKHPLLTSAIIFYSASLFFCSFQHVIFFLYLAKHKHLLVEKAEKVPFRRALAIACFGPGCYICAVIASLLSPFLSFFFIIIALAFYLFIAPSLIKQEL